MIVILQKYQFSEYPLSTTKAKHKSWHSFAVHLHSRADTPASAPEVLSTLLTALLNSFNGNKMI